LGLSAAGNGRRSRRVPQPARRANRLRSSSARTVWAGWRPLRRARALGPALASVAGGPRPPAPAAGHRRAWRPQPRASGRASWWRRAPAPTDRRLPDPLP